MDLRLTPHPEVNRVLVELHQRLALLLAADMIGMYLYGSLAYHAFEPGRSDIDFVVITEDHLPPPLVQALEKMHRNFLQEGGPWVKKLEGAYVPKAIIRSHDPDHPPVPTLNEGAFYLAPLGSDWVIQRKILREADSAISGPSLVTLIDPVSPGDIKRAILTVIDEWWEPLAQTPSRLLAPGYQPFAVFSMCRALYTLHTGELSGKGSAAEWALDSLPEEWSPLISHALHWADGDEIAGIERTAEFIDYAIREYREGMTIGRNDP